ncbi:MAG TPA: HD domain-containing phosphohydrolase [Planctomycetota bacterium]|nr:HD domain-containing phosphohydrolase [Planctomycetota bacterium]
MRRVTVHPGSSPDWLRQALDLPSVELIGDLALADIAIVWDDDLAPVRDHQVVIRCGHGDCPDRPRWLRGPSGPEELALFAGQLQLAGELAVSSRSHRRVLDSLGNRQRELGVLASVARRLGDGYSSEELPAHVLQEARRITGAEGGSLALVTSRREGRELTFAFAENEAIPVSFVTSSIALDSASLAGYVATTGETLAIDDAYAIPSDAPFRFNPDFDRKNGYRTVSLLVVPLIDRERRVLAVLQLINKVRDVASGGRSDARPFTPRDRELAEFLAALAAPVLESNRLYQQIEGIFDGMIHAAVGAIESRDPATSGHSSRVATGAMALARAISDCPTGPYSAVRFTAAELRELRVAGLLHDFGKIGVPEHILTKAEKLYPWNWDRLKSRYDVIRLAWLRQEAEAKLVGDRGRAERARLLAAEVPSLVAQLEQAKRPNLLDQRQHGFLDALLKRSVVDADIGEVPYLTLPEYSSLAIPRGSLTEQERGIIESHVGLTYRFLNRIPWSGALARVAEYAHGHHEKLDGSGYPLGLKADQIPAQARVLAIVDVFDALAAWDRPYKPAVPVDKTLDILQVEADAGRVDGEMVRIFRESRCYEAMVAIIRKGQDKRDMARRPSSEFMVKQVDVIR